MSAAMEALRDARTLRRVFKPALDAQRVIQAAPLPTAMVLAEVAQERERQRRLLAASKIGCDCANPDVNDFKKLAVLTEELGEVAEALQRPGQLSRAVTAHKRKELIQLAAVAVAWAESIKD